MSTETSKNRLFLRAAYRISRSRRGRSFLEFVSRPEIVQRLALGGPKILDLWNEDAAFQRVAVEPAALSLSSRRALFHLYQVALSVRDLPGDIAEVGVYQGGTALLLSRVFSGRGKEFFAFDTFVGMPGTVDPDLDRFELGDFADTSVEVVKRVLSDAPNITFGVGVFPDTAHIAEGRSFALVHVDVDIYQSVLDCCEFFYPRLGPGGAMVFDDYGFRSCPGARKAVDEFFAKHDEVPVYFETAQAVVWKGRSTGRERNGATSETKNP